MSDKPIQLPTQRVKDTEAVNRMVEGLMKRHKDGNIRCGLVLLFDNDGFPHLSAANTTLADESYAVALLQERLMRLIAT